ncbi:MAG: ubiquinol-cytochrome c reductase iron-sulfur subunit [Cyclonatronaceae bacterium]
MKTEKPTSISRKDFLRTAGSTALFAAFGIAISSCSSVVDADSDNVSDTSGTAITIEGDTIILDLDADELESLQDEGGWLLIRDARTLIVNIDGQSYRAFTSVCTHTGCSTNWEFNGALFICTCHDSRFNTGGEVVQGPATRDLEEFSVVRDGNIVTINKAAQSV